MKTITRMDVEALKREMPVLDEMTQRSVQLGFQLAMQGGFFNDLAAYSAAIMSYTSAGSDFGGVNYDMIHMGDGIKDGYNYAKEHY